MEIEQEHQEGESQKASSVDDVNKESEEVIGDATPGVENTKDQSNENTDSNEGTFLKSKLKFMGKIAGFPLMNAILADRTRIVFASDL